MRPRTTNNGEPSAKRKKKNKKKAASSVTMKTTVFVRGSGGKKQSDEDAGQLHPNNSSSSSKHPNTNGTNNNVDTGTHRFGRVMEKVPCLNRPRFSTVSIAVPGSVVSNCQTRELRTVVVGQIARAAAVYHVDEIIVFDDHLTSGYNTDNNRRPRPNYRDRNNNHQNSHANAAENNKDMDKDKDDTDPTTEHKYNHNRLTISEPHAFMARTLQYCECPQYLRRVFFPMHPDLQFAGLLPPLDAPHHVRAGEHSRYREGVVMEHPKMKTVSLVNVGIWKTPVEIDRVLTPGVRCTVLLEHDDTNTATTEPTTPRDNNKVRGRVVSPDAPREHDGTYWGYTTRLASSIKAVLDDDQCPYDGGYDLKIGTSERGDVTVDDTHPGSPFQLPKFQHALIVFGGVAGIEECVDADESLKLSGKDSKRLFDMWVNTCPFQGSRTIRTEEAVLLSLARLRPHIMQNEAGDERPPLPTASNDGVVSVAGGGTNTDSTKVVEDVEFSDDPPSDESSEGE